MNLGTITLLYNWTTRQSTSGDGQRFSYRSISSHILLQVRGIIFFACFCPKAQQTISFLRGHMRCATVVWILKAFVPQSLTPYAACYNSLSTLHWL